MPLRFLTRRTNGLKGIILVKVYANYFLDSIRRSQREGESTYLINKMVFIWQTLIKIKNLVICLKMKNNNFFVDYPAVSKDLVTKCNERRQETDE